MAPIGTIKLRSPALLAARFAASPGRRPESRAALPAAMSLSPRGRRGTGVLSARRPGAPPKPARLARAAATPRPGHDAIAIDRANTLVFASISAPAAHRIRPSPGTAAAGFAGLPVRSPARAQVHCNASRQTAQRVQKLIPPAAGPVISAEKNRSGTIAYLTRKIKVGLMANRDDHVIIIPVVLAWRPARSGG